MGNFSGDNVDFVRFQRMCDYVLKRIVVFLLIIVYVAAVIYILFDKNDAWKCQYAGGIPAQPGTFGRGTGVARV